MKRFLISLSVICLFSISVLADGLTATLQQGEKMIPFYGVNAFVQAYDSASNGAIITLSAGKFSDVPNIRKEITVIGNFGLSDNSVERTILSSLNIVSNKVTIDGIYFQGSISLGAIEDFILRHSWVEEELKCTGIHKNTIIDQCVIKRESCIKQGRNYTIKNSTIGSFLTQNTSDNIAYIFNNVIYSFYRNLSATGGRTVVDVPVPVAIYKNNIIYTEVANYSSNNSSYYIVMRFNSPSEFYSNCFHNRDYRSSTSYKSAVGASSLYIFSDGCIKDYNTFESSLSSVTLQYPSTDQSKGKGQDNTLKGPYGGSGFSLYPSIPRITGKTIDSMTDGDGKINVKISVSVQQ